MLGVEALCEKFCMFGDGSAGGTIPRMAKYAILPTSLYQNFIWSIQYIST